MDKRVYCLDNPVRMSLHRGQEARVAAQHVSSLKAGGADRDARPVLGVRLAVGCIFVVMTCMAGGMRSAAARPRAEAQCMESVLAYAPSPGGAEWARLVGSDGPGCGGKEIVIARMDGRRGLTRRFTVGRYAAGLSWEVHGQVAFVDGERHDNLEILDTGSGTIRRAVSVPGAILNYAFSPDGRRMDYVYRPEGKDTRYVSVQIGPDSGVALLALPKFATRGYFGTVSRVGVASFGNPKRGTAYDTKRRVSEVAWLSNPLRPVMLRQSSFSTPSNYTLADVRSGDAILGPERLREIYTVAASSTSALYAVAARGPSVDGFDQWEPMHVFVVDGSTAHMREIPGLAVHRVLQLKWQGSRDIWADVQYSEPDGGALDQRLVEIGWPRGRVIRTISWPHGSLTGCVFDLEGTVAVCRAETLTKAGPLVRIDLSSPRPEFQSLGGPVKSLDLSFQDVRVSSRSGRVSTGFLALPRKAKSQRKGRSRPVPLAILLYGFQRTFAQGGEWIHAYPVERLVRAGIAVLLLNFPQTQAWRMGDAAAARQALLEEPLSTVDNAPDAVRAAGVAVGRVMVMGWSWGGFIAAHAIEHSCRFRAAEIGDPAQWNAASYGLYGPLGRALDNGLFGGPPYGKYLANYESFDPMHSGKVPDGPILFEFVSRNVNAGQYLEEWRAAGTSLEAFAYHYSVHALTVKDEARISRRRNLAWAKLNLLGSASVPPSALSQLGLSVPAATAYRCGQK